MKRISTIWTSVCVAACFVVFMTALHAGNKEAVSVGSKAPEFALQDIHGKKQSLKSVLSDDDTKLVILGFIATRCPISRAYDEHMQSIYSDYKDKGVRFIGINSNGKPMEDLEEMKKHADENGLTFPIVKDVDNIVADKYGAEVTPHMYVIDRKGIVRYVGRIADAPRGKNIKTHDLRNALDDLLNGKDVTVAATKAFGCSIKRVKKV